MTSRRVFVQDDEIRIRERSGQISTTGIGEARRPCPMVSVEISENIRVTVGDLVEKRNQIRAVPRLTGRGRWNVEIEDVEFRAVEDDVDSLKLDVVVVEEAAVDGGERERIVDEEGQSSPSPPLANFV